MVMKNKIVLIGCLLILCASNLMGQITIGKSEMSFEDFTKELEINHNIHVFYNPAWTKNIYLKKAYADENVNSILKEILSPHKINFLVNGNSIILTGNIDLDMGFDQKKSNLITENIEQEVASNSTKDLESLKEQEYIIHNIGNSIGQKQVKLRGFVKYKKSSTPLQGVEIFLPDIKKGVTSGKTGYYEIKLPPGRHNIIYKFIGLRETTRKINIRGDGRLDVEMIEESTELREVQVIAKDDQVKRTSMGVNVVNIEDINNLPSALGEPDIIKSTTMLAGVESAGEGSVGFNVRGGSADQNLILIDNAPIYYPAHFFGFFAAFNSDMIEEANLYKASIPNHFGGRISSVYELKTQKNLSDKFSGKLGISPITSKLYIETPIVKNKLSFQSSFRFTYSNWILDLIDSEELNNSKANFHDLHGKLSYKPNSKNQIDFSYYYSNDDFQLHSDSTYNFKNLIGSINWKHRINEKNKILSNAYYSNYSYVLESDEIPESSFALKHEVIEMGIKSQLVNEKENNSVLNFGYEAKHYQIKPGDLSKLSELSSYKNQYFNSEKGIELALFTGFKFNPLPKLSAEIGIRYSMFGNLGDSYEMKYVNDDPSTAEVRDSIERSGLYNNYHGPEFRVNFSYDLSTSSAIKLSYNRSRQNVHLLTNSMAISPTDTWRLTNKYLKPQVGDQYSLGYYKNIGNKAYEVSLETYYKEIENAKDYKDGAQLFLKQNIESEVINVDGKNYGLEFSLTKKSGRINGTMSYSYSRSYFKTKDKTGSFSIKNGEYYRAPFDKPHNIKAAINFKISRRLIFSTNTVFNTGRPATFPIGHYTIQDIPISYYSQRNEYRIPNYFRTDLSLRVIGNLKKDKLFHSNFTFGIYNVTGRKNAYSVYFRSDLSGSLGYKLSIFGQAIPMVSYNIEF